MTSFFLILAMVLLVWWLIYYVSDEQHKLNNQCTGKESAQQLFDGANVRSWAEHMKRQTITKPHEPGNGYWGDESDIE